MYAQKWSDVPLIQRCLWRIKWRNVKFVLSGRKWLYVCSLVLCWCFCLDYFNFSLAKLARVLLNKARMSWMEFCNIVCTNWAEINHVFCCRLSRIAGFHWFKLTQIIVKISLYEAVLLLIAESVVLGKKLPQEQIAVKCWL